MITALVEPLNVTVQFPRVTSPSGLYCQVLKFITVSGDSTYTSAYESDLSEMVGKEIYFATMDGSVISALCSWDDTTFTINSAITISGGETIVIFFR